MPGIGASVARILCILSHTQTCKEALTTKPINISIANEVTLESLFLITDVVHEHRFILSANGGYDVMDILSG